MLFEPYLINRHRRRAAEHNSLGKERVFADGLLQDFNHLCVGVGRQQEHGQLVRFQQLQQPLKRKDHFGLKVLTVEENGIWVNFCLVLIPKGPLTPVDDVR